MEGDRKEKKEEGGSKVARNREDDKTDLTINMTLLLRLIMGLRHIAAMTSAFTTVPTSPNTVSRVTAE